MSLSERALPGTGEEIAGLRASLDQWSARDVLPGAAMAVGVADRVVFEYWTGHACRYGGARRAVGRDTLFDAASSTKVMVTLPLVLTGGRPPAAPGPHTPPYGRRPPPDRADTAGTGPSPTAPPHGDRGLNRHQEQAPGTGTVGSRTPLFGSGTAGCRAMRTRGRTPCGRHRVEEWAAVGSVAGRTRVPGTRSVRQRRDRGTDPAQGSGSRTRSSSATGTRATCWATCTRRCAPGGSSTRCSPGTPGRSRSCATPVWSTAVARPAWTSACSSPRCACTPDCAPTSRSSRGPGTSTRCCSSTSACTGRDGVDPPVRCMDAPTLPQHVYKRAPAGASLLRDAVAVDVTIACRTEGHHSGEASPRPAPRGGRSC